MEDFNMQHQKITDYDYIRIIGCSGSGKTTLLQTLLDTFPDELEIQKNIQHDRQGIMK